MLNAEPDFEMLNEIDKWRFVAFVMLELQLKHPVSLNPDYLTRKGFNLKKRPIALTIKMLQNFTERVTQDEKLCSVEKEIEKEIDIEKEKNILSQIDNLLGQFPTALQKDIKTYLNRVATKNKSGLITDSRKMTLLNELYNARSHCADDDLFSYALEASITHDAPNIGYINAVIRNKKTKRPL